MCRPTYFLREPTRAIVRTRPPLSRGPQSRSFCRESLLPVERNSRVPRTAAAVPVDRRVAPLALQDVAVAAQRHVAAVRRERAVLVRALVGNLAALGVRPCVQQRIRDRLELLVRRDRDLAVRDRIAVRAQSNGAGL